ncbi:hypothetical protein OH686_04940 [Pseudomonas sp. SO81]|nr:hypothetical protein OH686_04940 [Pseudomonas sp. SO81]
MGCRCAPRPPYGVALCRVSLAEGSAPLPATRCIRATSGGLSLRSEAALRCSAL